MYRLEILTVILIFLYQYANSSPTNSLLGVEKRFYLQAFFIYSILISLCEIFVLIRLLTLKKHEVTTGDKLNMLIGSLFFLGIGFFILLNEEMHSNIYGLGTFCGVIYLIKACSFGIFAWNIKSRTIR